MVLLQNWPFLNLFFLGIIEQENVFKPFLTHGSGLKLASFPSFGFRQYRQENVFYDILER